jgi:molecular chaperone HtpG
VADEADVNPAVRLRSYGLPAQPVLEINPRHPLIQRLNRDAADPRLADWAHVLYAQSVLTLGAPIEDPARFVSRLNGLLVSLAGEAGEADGQE